MIPHSIEIPIETCFENRRKKDFRDCNPSCYYRSDCWLKLCKENLPTDNFHNGQDEQDEKRLTISQLKERIQYWKNEGTEESCGYIEMYESLLRKMGEQK